MGVVVILELSVAMAAALVGALSVVMVVGLAIKEIVVIKDVVVNFVA
jgi:hypothetical protein